MQKTPGHCYARAYSLEWNTRQLEYYGELPQLEIQQFSEHHFRITRVRDGRQMDYWPSTGKAMWMGFQEKKVFRIKDIDEYLERMFCPEWWKEQPFGTRPLQVGPPPKKLTKFEKLLHRTNSIYKP